jgi:hypothetical protein
LPAIENQKGQLKLAPVEAALEIVPSGVTSAADLRYI